MRMIFGKALSYLHTFFAVYSGSFTKQKILRTLRRKQKKKMSSCGKHFFTQRKGVYQT